MAQELFDIDPDEVSPVRRGAIRKRFNILKSDDGKVTLAKSLVDALAEPFEDEGALVDTLRKSGVSEDGQEAAVAAARLLKGFEDELPDGLRLDVGAVVKAASEQHTPPERDAIAAAARTAAAVQPDEEEDDGAGEPLATVSKGSALEQRLLARVEKMVGPS